jgi:aspartyl-tRNA(Asn)/glutamyl-tRNA(Gln) amidotransferase subunit C
MDAPLTLEEVRRIARLARLRLSDAEAERFRRQLAEVLEHVGKLEELDLEGVEPLVRIHTENNAGREVESDGDALDRDWLLSSAPDARSPYLAVPPMRERPPRGRA